MCCRLTPMKVSLSLSYNKVSSSSVENDSTCVSFSSRWQITEVFAVSSSSLGFCGWPWKGFYVYICIVLKMIIPHISTLAVQKMEDCHVFRWASRSFEHQRTRATLTCLKIRLAAWTALNVQERDYFVLLKEDVGFLLAAQMFCLMGRKCILMIRLCVSFSVYDQTLWFLNHIGNIQTTEAKPMWALLKLKHLCLQHHSFLILYLD